MFGELALWFYKRGAARAALNRADAEQDLRRAVSSEGRKWMLGRAHFELGKLALKAGRTADGRRSATPHGESLLLNAESLIPNP